MNRLVLTIFVAASTLGAAAQLPAAGSFADILRQAEEQSPSLRAVGVAAAADAARRSADNALPGTEVSASHLWPQRSGVEARWGVEVTQALDWPGAYAVRRRATANARNAHGLLLTAARINLRKEVIDQLLALVNARKQRVLLRQIVDNFNSLDSLTDRGLARQQVTILDLHSVRLDRLQAVARLHDAEAAEQAAEQALKARFPNLTGLDLLNDYPQSGLAPLQVYLTRGGSAESLQSQAEAQLRRADEAVEGMGKYPGFSVGYAHNFEEGTHFNGLSFAIQLPAYGSSKRAKAARLEAESAELMAESAERQRRAEVMSLYGEAQRVESLLGEYDRTLSATNYLSLLRTGLDAGQLTMPNYLYMTNAYLERSLEQLALQLRLNQLLHSLAALAAN